MLLQPWMIAFLFTLGVAVEQGEDRLRAQLGPGPGTLSVQHQVVD
jgi:hypothetical protein